MLPLANRCGPRGIEQRLRPIVGAGTQSADVGVILAVIFRRRTMAIFGVAMAVLVVGCGGSAPSTATTITTRPSTAAMRAVRGERLGVHVMAYPASNRVTVLFDLSTRAPATVVVGKPADVLVMLFPLARPVWVGLHPQRLTVNAHDGPGRIAVATDACPKTGSCDMRPLYAPTGLPIPPAPTPGLRTQHGFTLHLATEGVLPGRYDMTFAIRYPSNLNHPTVLDISDTLHVRLDLDTHVPLSTHCTLDDLHHPAPPMPTPHPVTDTFVLVDGEQRLDPPPTNAHPRITAAMAWSTLSTSRAPTGGGTDALVLTSFSSTFPRRPSPDGTTRAEIHAVLAWVLYTYHVASPDSGPRPPPNMNQPTTRPPVCVFFDGIDAIDATTGQALGGTGYTSDTAPVPF
jgi:hypothetical protein